MLWNRHLLSPDDQVEWLFATTRWLLESFGHDPAFHRRLVTPTEEDFPITATGGHELAVQVFGMVQRHAGLSSWPCRLESQGDVDTSEWLRDIGQGHLEQKGAAGTFSRREEVVITYSERQLGDLDGLIATFAHELSHYLLFSAPTPPPGGPKALEPATDVGAVFLGFGIFLANTAFRFDQFNTATGYGWSASRLGYLGDQALAYTLAIFLSLRGESSKVALRSLRPNPAAYFKAALKDLARRRAEEVARLRELCPPN
ncbi:MAG: hypothetical protein C4321_09200 [Chloroflexota bacterium]